MNLVHWIFFLGTVGVSLIFALYDIWVRRKYAIPTYATGVTGCEVARLVLDSMGVRHISVTPIEPPHKLEEYLSGEGFFLEKRIYEGRDILSLVLAARQSFLKGQLSNITFWVNLKKRMALAAKLAVTLGWIFFLAGLFVPSMRFLGNLGLGAFVVVMIFSIFDLPFELEVEEKTSKILKATGGLVPHEYRYFKMVNQAVALSGLTCLVRVPFGACGCFLKRK